MRVELSRYRQCRHRYGRAACECTSRGVTEGGEVVGSYGGSGNIDARNQMTFKTVPPGRYVLRGRPNPGSDAEETGPVTVDLKGGQTAEVTLKAK